MPKSILSLLIFFSATAAMEATVFQSTVATGLTSGTGLAVAGDGRVFVLQRTGEVRLVENGILSGTSVMNAAAISGFYSGSLENGLIGVALDPNFGANGFVYLHYNRELPGGDVSNRVSRFTMVGNSIDTATEQILIDLEATGSHRHVGGGMVFGADGKLYVGVGDRDVPASSQTATDTWGSVLRLNPNGTFAGGDLFPLDNPFLTLQTDKGSAVFVQGLRNPFGLAVNPANGLMLINDAGESNWEEINAVAFGNPIGAAAGANFGWPNCEGDFVLNTINPCNTSFPTHTSPLYAYGSNGTGDFAITGGAFYLGDYLFGDWGSGKIRRMTFSGGTATVDPVLFATVDGFGLSALATSADGMGVYYLHTGGTLGFLTTVPEPATCLTVAMALTLLLLRQTRFQLRPASIKRRDLRLGNS